MINTEFALRRARECLENGKPKIAEKIYRKVLQEYPNDLDSLLGLSAILRNRGWHKHAETLLRQALAAAPDAVAVQTGLGDLSRAQGRLQHAMNCYRRALSVQPDAAAAHTGMALVFHRQGNLEEAAVSFRRALDAEPDCAQAHAGIGSIQHAQGKLSSDQLAHYAAMHDALGETLRKEGNLRESLTCFRQAIAMDPALASAHFHLGLRVQRQHLHDQAEACFKKALEIEPDQQEVYACLGRLYQKLGRMDEAAAAFRQALKLINPRYAAAIENASDQEYDEQECAPPQQDGGETVVGQHAFPSTPPVTSDEAERPFWTVVVPLHNRSAFVLECLYSILAQWTGHEDMEILALDNASNPPLHDLVKSLGGGIVRYYRNRQNIGPRRNFNLAIALSRGHWFHIIPDDEYVLPGFYSRLRESLQDCSENVGAAFTAYENINENGEITFVQDHVGMNKGINEKWLYRIGVANFLNPCAVVVRRSTHEHLGGYDLNNLFTPDWELYKRIAAFYDWWCEPEVLAIYREHSDSITGEVLTLGAQGASYRQAIEISESYLPPENRDRITTKARQHYFIQCLRDAARQMQSGNVSAAFRLTQEAIRIDSSAEAVERLFKWLNQKEMASLRKEVVSKLSAIIDDTDDSGDLYYSYP